MESQRRADPAHLRQLQRFLYVGLEENKYFPGCWKSHKYFEPQVLSCLAPILEAEPTCQAICDIIRKTYKDGLYSRFETIAFVLCKCLLLGNKDMKMKVYKLVEEVCQTPEELFTFIGFTRKLKSGFGTGWRRTIGNWYRNKPPMELAMEVARVKGHCHQKHQHVVRKSHLKLEEGDNARESILKYVLYGMKRSRSDHNSQAEAVPVLEYIQRVEELRHCEDPSAAAVNIRENNLTLRHVPGHFLTNQEVWEAVLPNMPLDQILFSLLRIHNMGYLAPNSTTVAIVESLLTNADLVKQSKISPIQVYIALKTYMLKKVPMTHAKLNYFGVMRQRRRVKQHIDPDTQQWTWVYDKPKNPKEQKYWGIDTPPNPVVESALLKTLSLSWQQPAPNSKVRYLITCDMRDHMFQGRHYCTTSFKPPKKETPPAQSEGQEQPKSGKKKKGKPAAEEGQSSNQPQKVDKTEKGNKRELAECFYYTCITPGHAAAILALTLYRREKEVKIAVFTESGIQVVELGKDSKNLTLEKLIEKLRKVKMGRVKVQAPIEWAMSTNRQVDVFINMIDRQSRFLELDPKDRTGRGSGGQYAPLAESDTPDHCPVRALQRYRQQCNLPNARLITMSLASHRVRTADAQTAGVLDIIGIDQHVPDLIQAFALGLFD